MTLLAFGYHPIISLLTSPYFRWKKIMVQDKYQNDKELLTLITQRKIAYQLLTKNDFTRFNFPPKNQGLVAFLADYDYLSLAQLLQIIPRRKYSLLVMLDSIEDPHNFGAICRSSAAFAVDGIIIARKNQVPVTSTVIKVSAGGIAYLPICQVSSLSEAVNELKKKGYKIVATTCEKNSTKYQDWLN